MFFYSLSLASAVLRTPITYQHIDLSHMVSNFQLHLSNIYGAEPKKISLNNILLRCYGSAPHKKIFETRQFDGTFIADFVCILNLVI